MRTFLTALCAVVLSVSIAHAQEVLAVAGNPLGCVAAVEFEPKESMLHVHVAGRMSVHGCDVTPELVEEAMTSALQRHAEIGTAPLKLIFLGRIYDYPWLSKSLTAWAGRSKEWDPVTGKPVLSEINENEVVSQFIIQMAGEQLPPDEKLALADRSGLTFLANLLPKFGYRLVGASVEKVISGYDGEFFAPSNMLNPKLLPFDALVHLRIAKSP